jgi:hypothetical protein
VALLPGCGPAQPLHSRSTAPAGWPVAVRLSETQAGAVEALLTEATPVRVVSSGVVGLAGPVATGWRLEARNGSVLASGS